jgi:hypothetical protein
METDGEKEEAVEKDKEGTGKDSRQWEASG